MAANPGPPPSTAQPQGGNTGDVELTTTDEVKEYCHEGDGENDEYLNSMDLHDIKSELEKDAEQAEVRCLKKLVMIVAGSCQCAQCTNFSAMCSMMYIPDNLWSHQHYNYIIIFVILLLC